MSMYSRHLPRLHKNTVEVVLLHMLDGCWCLKVDQALKDSIEIITRSCYEQVKCCEGTKVDNSQHNLTVIKKCFKDQITVV